MVAWWFPPGVFDDFLTIGDILKPQISKVLEIAVGRTAISCNQELPRGLYHNAGRSWSGLPKNVESGYHTIEHLEIE